MDKKPNKIHENLIFTKLYNHIVQCRLIYITMKNTNIPYNWPASSQLNNGYMSSYALIGIRY